MIRVKSLGWCLAHSQVFNKCLPVLLLFAKTFLNRNIKQTQRLWTQTAVVFLLSESHHFHPFDLPFWPLCYVLQLIGQL